MASGGRPARQAGFVSHGARDGRGRARTCAAGRVDSPQRTRGAASRPGSGQGHGTAPGRNRRDRPAGWPDRAA
ncbi:hypothetical protein AMJ85_10865 [candidate division BRC1 bacterium SM23_51]|nr:MAG: hypothetical protein AMJ85_10865 [candidate division BRC1 bacterium SM23_51]